MNNHLSELTIKLLNINIYVWSFAIVQKFLGINILPASFEAFAIAIFLSFQIIIFLLYWSALIQEISGIRKALEKITGNGK